MAVCLNWDFWDWVDLWDFVVADEEGLRWVGICPLCPSDISPASGGNPASLPPRLPSP